LLPQNQSRVRSLTAQIVQSGFLTRYSREDELESDRVGFYLLQRAGYRPEGLRTFLEKLGKIAPSAPVPFLSTHPATPERVSRLRALETLPPAAAKL
jgi:predicted Zn-dependent protease